MAILFWCSMVLLAGDVAQPFFAPKGLRHVAQGCRIAATLGEDMPDISFNLSGVEIIRGTRRSLPRVAAQGGNPGLHAAAPSGQRQVAKKDELSNAFTFHDVAEVDGRSVMIFRPVELVEKQVRPLAGVKNFSPTARYGLLPVGTNPDTSLAFVWDSGAEGGPALWLDADGDGRLIPEERFAFSGKEQSVPFRLVIRKGEGEDTVQRTVVFRRSSLGPGLTYAVRGCLRGKLAFGATAFDTVLVDANGDGCFHGAGVDRLWIDLDRDGKFDPLTEQFTLGRPLTVEGVAYIVAADPLGKTVRARQRGSETGRLRLDLPARLKGQVKRFHADLLNDVGEMISLTTEGQSLEVPSSRYRLSALTLELTDVKNRRWHYSFSRHGDTIFDVPPQAEKQITLLADCQLTIYHDGKPAGIRPDTDLTARPFLFDPCGLYPTNCFVEEGTLQTPSTAEVRLVAADGKVLAAFTSGFN